MSFIENDAQVRKFFNKGFFSAAGYIRFKAVGELHHAAFDNYLITVAPDYRVRVRRDVLDEEDGPMLRHGLQEMHGQRIITPHRPELRPDRELLAWRLERFEKR